MRPKPVRPALALSVFAAWLLLAASAAHALPTFRAPLTAALQADVDHSGTVTCGDVLRYTLAIEPQSEFGTDLQNVAFDIVPDTNILFDPASVVAINSDQTVHVTADPLALHVEFGRVCNSAGCPGPPLALTFDGQIRVVNTGSAVAIQGTLTGTNFTPTATDGTPNAAIEPTVTPFTPCPPTRSVRATKSYALVDDRDHDGLVDPGDAIRYTVQILSTGAGVGVRSVRFDSGVDPNSALLVGSVTTSRGTVVTGNGAGNSTVRVDVGDLAPSGAVTITFDVRIATPLPAAATSIACQGTVTSTVSDIVPTLTDDPSTPAAADPTRTPIDFDPDLALAKSDGGALAVPGAVVVYTLTASNLSTRQGATGVVLTETVPAQASFSGAGSSPGWSCAGTTCTLAVGSIGAGASTARTFAVRIASPLPAGTTQIDNTARVADDGANGPDPNLKNNAASDATPIDRARVHPDLSIAKDDGGISVRPGEVVVYAVTFANRGDIGATGVTLHETVPPHTSYVAAGSSVGWSCADGSPAGTACTLRVGTVAGGASATGLFAVRAAARFPAGVTEIVNTASVDDDGGNGTDGDPANNQATDRTPLLGVAPDLHLTKTLDPGSDPRPGGLLLWRFRWENRGNQDAAGVELKDPLTPHTSYVAASSTPGWTCVPAAATQVLCSRALGTVPAGGAGDALLALRVVQPLPAGVEIVANCAELSDVAIRAGRRAPRRAPSTCAEAPIAAAPDLVLTKDDGGITAREGQTVAYVLRVENRGDQGARAIVLLETVPEHTTFSAAGSTPGWTCDGRRCQVAIGDLAVGASATRSFAVKIDASVPSAVTQIVNTATASDDGTSGPDANPADNLASDMTPLTGNGGPGPAPLLLAAKIDSFTLDLGQKGLADAGDRIRYQVLIDNPGTGAALDVVFRTGVDPRTTLLNGSVTAEPGTILRGNGAGDDTIEVRIDSIPPGGRLEVNFEVLVDRVDREPIVCQGQVLSGNAPPRLTDDPSGPGTEDPTRTLTALPEGPAVDVPTLGQFGAGVLALVLGMVGFERLRRRFGIASAEDWR